MSKKQLLALSLIAAIPATGLLVKMLFSLGYILADASSAGTVVWIIYVICLLGSVFFASLPLWLWLYYPAAGFSGVPAVAGGLPHPAAALGAAAPGSTAPAIDDDVEGEEDYESDYEEIESDESAGGGESLFDEDPLDDDFDDEFEGDFDDEN